MKRSRAKAWLMAPAGLLLLVCLVYAPSLGNGFIYDDRVQIIQQQPPTSFVDALSVFTEPHLRNLDYYRPLPRLTLVLQKAWHGDEPLPYHLFNVALMGVAALMAYALLRLPLFGIRRLPAFLGAALFALHPIAAQCVYQITVRDTAMPAISILAAFYAYLRPGRGWRVAAMSLFVAALLCKEQAVVLPALFVLADALALSGDPPGRRARAWLMRYLPVAAIVAAYLLFRLLFFSRVAGVQMVFLDNPLGPLESLLYRLQVIFVPFVRLVYEPRFEVWFSLWRLSLALAAAACIGCLAYRLRAALGSQLLLWTGWFFLISLPTSNFVFQEAPYAERYELLSLLAVVALLAAVASASARGWAAAIGIPLVLCCAAISIHRGSYFKDEAAFMEHWLQTDPASPQAHASYAELLSTQGRPEEAMEQYREALRLEPAFRSARINLANLLLGQRRLDEAMTHYRAVLEKDPDSIEAINNLGAALEFSGRPSEAEQQYRRALRIDPENPISHYNLASILYARGRFTEASDHLRRTLAHMPSHLQARELLESASTAEAEVRRILDAYAASGRAIHEEAAVRNVLGGIFADRQRLDEAVASYRRALEIEPDYAEAHSNLGAVLQMQGDLEGAIRQYRRALEIRPDDGEFHYNMASALFGLGRYEKAIEGFEQALRYSPKHAEAHYYLGMSLWFCADYGKGLGRILEAVELDRRWGAALDTAAWILATDANPALRDPEKAVSLADRAARLSGNRDAATLDVLAAAYASAGRFDDAIRTIRAALQLSPTAGMKKRLETYMRREPYRAPAGSWSPASPSP